MIPRLTTADTVRLIGVDTELLEAFDDYRTYGNTSAERVRLILMKRRSDDAHGTTFVSKFAHKIDCIFSGLPKPKAWVSFATHDLPLLTAIDDEVQEVAVHRSNNQNRDATPGQKAMAFAMAFPSATQGGDRKSSFFRKLENEDTPSKPQISKARYVLRNSPMVEGERYPRRCLDVMNGLISLTEAY